MVRYSAMTTVDSSLQSVSCWPVFDSSINRSSKPSVSRISLLAVVIEGDSGCVKLRERPAFRSCKKERRKREQRDQKERRKRGKSSTGIFETVQDSMQ